MLVAAMNPCPCGHAGDPERICSCSPFQVVRYRQKISGPILDRIDLHIEVPRVKFEKLEGKNTGAEKSESIRARVESARAIQRKRFENKGCHTNAEMTSHMVKEFCALNDETREVLRNAVTSLKLSARAYMRILKVARTIADLSSAPTIEVPHLAEALQYRFKE